jgi:hypothetical protein
LLSVESFDGSIWELAYGEGAIAREADRRQSFRRQHRPTRL